MRGYSLLCGSIATVFLFSLLCIAEAAPPIYPAVVAGRTLQFPRDFGAHPDYRLEWWYATGWLETNDGKPLGFQITFFRSTLNIDAANPSIFAPKQLVFAHAALSDPAQGHLLHDQRIARTAFDLAGAKEIDTDAWIDDWRFVRSGEQYKVQIHSREFALQLSLTPKQLILLQGTQGFSRKGPAPPQASYYYSQPHLEVSGNIIRAGKKEEHVRGTAWLDHEWSTAYLAEDAAGWDWTGINLDDGGALMLFRIRTKDGGKLWAGGTLRRADSTVTTFGPEAITFTPLRHWRSPHTQANYPVAMKIEANDLTFELQPLMDDQELDSRASTAAVYWEGAVTALQNGKTAGRGYLELTGYLKPLQLSGKPE